MHLKNISLSSSPSEKENTQAKVECVEGGREGGVEGDAHPFSHFRPFSLPFLVFLFLSNYFRNPLPTTILPSFLFSLLLFTFFLLFIKIIYAILRMS
ncbi:unnamed protein product [Meloidogyne enterolobii]|uniref:Uncharacterized protein n=1 Tax=Meloidogyne enterolobii TaxID=390850 RepID=A0ACB0YN25_MELEN